MALSYSEAGALQSNIPFGLRVQVAAISFANYIQGEAPNTPQHNARLRWANQVYQNPGGIARQIQVPGGLGGPSQKFVD